MAKSGIRWHVSKMINTRYDDSISTSKATPIWLQLIWSLPSACLAMNILISYVFHRAAESSKNLAQVQKSMVLSVAPRRGTCAGPGRRRGAAVESATVKGGSGVRRVVTFFMLPFPLNFAFSSTLTHTPTHSLLPPTAHWWRSFVVSMSPLYLTLLYFTSL